MELPVRIVASPPEEPVILVDGAVESRGLHLSHWPGNRTPAALRHDLSTGSALAFARLTPAERARLAGGATAIVNNHYDTDGMLALWAVRHPRRALVHAERLLAAARAGDFFQVPDERAFCVDRVVDGLNDPRRSPLADRIADASEAERRTVVVAFLMDELGSIVGADRPPFPELWEPELERLRADRRGLAACVREEDAALDLCYWHARSPARFGGRPAGPPLDPGRHALFGATPCSAVLVAVEVDGGTRYRAILSTLTWFDLASRAPRPRPDLERLAAELDRREGRGPDDAVRWRAQPSSSPSPELWFGPAGRAPFAEHAPELAPSRLAADEVVACLRRVLADAAAAQPSPPSSSST